jgi:precorrin-6B methylase 2
VARLPLRVLPSRRKHYARKARIETALGVDSHRVVRSGPFAGMRYIEDSIGSALTPKILGSYELELNAAIEQLITSGDLLTIVDIGAAEGYYAVGLALRCPDATVYAYDSSPTARKLCQEMVVLNKVTDRVHIRGCLSSEALGRVASPGALVFCDCEGYEKTLIDPLVTPKLRDVHLIVELHDLIDPSISSTIVERFRKSHQVEVIDSQERDPAMFTDVLQGVVPEDRQHALDEGRPAPMQWAVISLRESGCHLPHSKY